MKNTFSLRVFIVITASALFVGCSKEFPIEPGPETLIPKTSVLSNARVIPNNYGGITGTLSPIPEKCSIFAFNGAFVSSEIIPDLQTGVFKIENLPPGEYQLRILFVRPSGADYEQIVISRIKVMNDVISQIGTIYL